MSEEGFKPKEWRTVNENAQLLKDTIELLPTEFRCFDYATERTAFGKSEMRLKELEAKVETALHSRAGHAIAMNEKSATKEEIQEFIVLMRWKAEKYSQFADLLERIDMIENHRPDENIEERDELTMEND